MSRFGNIREGNPLYGFRMRLYSRTGYHLTILPHQQVIGINDNEGEFSQYQILEFTTGGQVGEVRIRGIYSNLYLCMNNHGILYGEENPRVEGTVFIESPYDQHNTYLSKKHSDRQWYVGIEKNGKPKLGPLTAGDVVTVLVLPLLGCGCSWFKQFFLQSFILLSINIVRTQSSNMRRGSLNMSRFGNVRQGNPHYGYRMRLYSRTGYHLTILPHQKVIGINDNEGEFSQYQIVEFTTAGQVGEVRIHGVYSNLYLCMNNHGILYGEENPQVEGTVFIESLYNQYNTYLSKNHSDRQWYVGIKKNGKPKLGPLTGYGQKSIQFLPLRVN